MDILIDALVNIRRELSMFDHIGEKYGLDLNSIPIDGAFSRQCLYRSGGCNESFISSMSSKDSGDSNSSKEKEKEKENANHATGIEKGCSVFFGPNPITKSYMDLFMSAASSGVSLLEGLVVLWASEVCYLRAWSHVKSLTTLSGSASAGGTGLINNGSGSGSGNDDLNVGGGGAEKDKPCSSGSISAIAASKHGIYDDDDKGDVGGVGCGDREFSNDADGGALRETLIPNWSSEEFRLFVGRIGDVVDEMARQVKGADESELLRQRCLEWWRHVLWLEERFWPDVVS